MPFAARQAKIALPQDKNFVSKALQFHPHEYTYSTCSSGRKAEDGK